MHAVPVISHYNMPAVAPAAKFDQLFDCYGPALYGLIAKSVSSDRKVAERLLALVFIAMHRQQEKEATVNNPVFIQLVQIMIRILNEEGYHPWLPCLQKQNALEAAVF